MSSQITYIFSVMFDYIVHVFEFKLTQMYTAKYNYVKCCYPAQCKTLPPVQLYLAWPQNSQHCVHSIVILLIKPMFSNLYLDENQISFNARVIWFWWSYKSESRLSREERDVNTLWPFWWWYLPQQIAPTVEIYLPIGKRCTNMVSQSAGNQL